MGKRKNKDPGGQPQIHPTRSFEQLVADATLAKLGGYINAEIEQLGETLAVRQEQSNEALFTRIIAIEEILMETVPGLTKEKLATRVADLQDRNDGYVPAEDQTTAKGDRVRLQIKTKTVEQAEYQGASRLQVSNIGSGRTIGPELETAILGMKAGETKEVLFGKDHGMQASITVDKVSRIPAPAAETTTEATAQPAAGPETEETASASPDAG